MAIITGVVPDPDRPGHVVLLVDGKPFATVPVAAAPKAGGDTAEVAQLAPLGAAERKTYERALNLLSFRARSKKELAKRLKEKGEPAPEVAVAIARLEHHGLLDDARYAESKARTGIVGKARSRRRIEQDLGQRGVARDVAQQAIARVYEEEGTSELAVAERAARKKLRSLEGSEPAVQRQKLYGFLARQGHPADVVRKVLKRVLDASVDDEA